MGQTSDVENKTEEQVFITLIHIFSYEKSSNGLWKIFEIEKKNRISVINYLLYIKLYIIEKSRQLFYYEGWVIVFLILEGFLNHLGNWYLYCY